MIKIVIITFSERNKDRRSANDSITPFYIINKVSKND